LGWLDSPRILQEQNSGNDEEHMTEQPLIASYGRRRGRRLRSGKQSLMDEVLPEVSVTLPERGVLDLKKIFPKAKEAWLEIGFGGGEHLAHQARQNPDTGIIGCEPYVNGIAGLLKSIHDEKLNNIRIYPDDVRLLLEKIPDWALSRVFILYPDPWPKARHHKRRLISKEFLDTLSRVMKPGAELRLATDWEDYATWMLERVLPHPGFTWTAKTCDDWLTPPADWLSTRYEQKALAEGRVPTYLRFVRR
jgi:tRNA (guanine-N7-)-methyltransferase